MERSAHNALMADKNSLISIQIAVTESARDKVKRLSDATDIPMKGVMSRIYEWFATLPQTAQRSILWPPENPADMDAMLIVLESLRTQQGEGGIAGHAAAAAARAMKQNRDQKQPSPTPGEPPAPRKKVS